MGACIYVEYGSEKRNWQDTARARKCIQECGVGEERLGCVRMCMLLCVCPHLYTVCALYGLRKVVFRHFKPLNTKIKAVIEYQQIKTKYSS